MTEPDYVIKICLLGEANVGKTSLVYRFIENQFRDNYKSTLGVNLLKKDLNIEGYGGVAATIWDLGGQESFRSLRKLYLEGANGALVIFDWTQKESFLKLDSWIQDFRLERKDEPILLIGNKDDLKDKKKVSKDESLELARRYGLNFLSTSAKTGSNVEEAFNAVTKTILDSQSAKSS
jgi:small GTP-binding protein